MRRTLLRIPAATKHIDRQAAEAWARRARSKHCVVCGKPHAKGHHIITQQQLRKTAESEGLDYRRLRWDQRNLLPLCERCHVRHHSRIAPVPLAVILTEAPKVLQLARELGIEWYLSREYPTRPR
jgi:5-methylcytosine-specific restriction endonuclease McrA